jgi:hypothetical protein
MMMMRFPLSRAFGTIAACLALALPVAASAQTEGSAAARTSKSGTPGDAKSSGRHTTHVEPYIEAAQIVTAELSPGHETLTYTQLAVGIDAQVAGRNTQAAVSLRYERRIGWGDRAEDGDTISGIARVSAAIVPQTLRVEAGVLAARTRIEGNGAAILAPLGDGHGVTQLYSAYAGPVLSTHAGDVKIDASYRFGYAKVEAPDVAPGASGQAELDVFDESTVHDAQIHAGTRPGEGLPVGIGVGAGYAREDVSNLDQRVEDFNVRADVTVPLAYDFAFVGGVGYEDLEISSHDALRDGLGVPVVGPDGRLVTDKSSPRVMAYDVSGLIWDAGVIWRPSRRTQLEAHVGRRYGATTWYGSLAYAPNARSSLNVAVYDNVAGFGGQLNRALAGLPAQFEVVRNPLTGDISGCVAALEQGSCLSGALGSLRSATFRARGVMASYNIQLGHIRAGIGGGYDRRKFIAAPGTVLAVANGVVDENIWLAGNLHAQLDRQSSLGADIFANWFQSGSTPDGKASAIGAALSYNRALTDHLSARAALAVEGVSLNEPLDDIWSASALVGVRYSF